MAKRTFSSVRKMEGKLNDVSTAFCIAKWKQTTLLLQGGLTQSCHHPGAHKIPQRGLLKTPSILHNTPFKLKVRHQMLSGIKPSECAYCWDIEKTGHLSDRAYKSSEPWAHPYFEESLQAGSKKSVDPSYVEVAFENTCNFKCAYCSPLSSSLWAAEEEKYGPFSPFAPLIKKPLNQRRTYEKGKKNPYIDAFWKWWPSLSENLRVFRITGGEPLLSMHTWKILDSLIEKPKTHFEFAINSNMGVPKKLVEKLAEKVNSLSGKVKKITIFTSIDTVGEQAEYIRYGLKEKLFWQNVDLFLSKTEGRAQLSYMITVNALSIVGLKKLLEKILEQKKRYPKIKISISTPHLKNPRYLSLLSLPKSFLRYLDDAIDFLENNISTEKSVGFRLSEKEKLRRVRQWMADAQISSHEKNRLRAEFHKMITEYDRRRGTCFTETFPEYIAFWNECKTLKKLTEVTQGFRYYLTCFLEKFSIS